MKDEWEDEELRWRKERGRCQTREREEGECGTKKKDEGGRLVMEERREGDGRQWREEAELREGTIREEGERSGDWREEGKKGDGRWKMKVSRRWGESRDS